MIVIKSRHLTTPRLIALALCAVLARHFVSAAEDVSSQRATQSIASRVDTLAQLPARLSADYRGVRALVLVRGGCIVWDYYGTPADRTEPLPVDSVTKSVLSILVGIAVDQGYLHLDQKLSSLLPETTEANVDWRVRDITVRDLLTMTSGFNPAIVLLGGGIRRPMINTPGSQFRYDNTSANLLSIFLTRAIAQLPRRFADENLFKPLGIDNYQWTTDGDGNLIGSTSLWLTARDIAKIGLLYLRHGRWGDRQIVSEKFVADSTVRHNDGGPPVRSPYGYLWWVKAGDSGPAAFFAAGSGSQLIYVVPQLDLVVAMASMSSVSGGSKNFVDQLVLPAAATLPRAATCVALR